MRFGLNMDMASIMSLELDEKPPPNRNRIPIPLCCLFFVIESAGIGSSTITDFASPGKYSALPALTSHAVWLHVLQHRSPP